MVSCLPYTGSPNLVVKLLRKYLKSFFHFLITSYFHTVTNPLLGKLKDCRNKKFFDLSGLSKTNGEQLLLAGWSVKKTVLRDNSHSKMVPKFKLKMKIKL